MKNRTYYGEYSLGYWVKLIQSRDIILPEYQRHFVWNKAKVVALIKALKEGRFVPPITIGAFRKNERIVNYIIDGQQRLTSLLLACIGRIPLLEKFESKGVNLANDAVVDEEAEGEGVDYSKEWTFNMIISSGDNSFDVLRERCQGDKYDDIGDKFSADDLRNIFMGFSYIVPGSQNPQDQQEFYTREFKDLNTTGAALNPLESRRSLYFWKEGYNDYFEPEFARLVVHRAVPKTSRPRCLDFVRYLALLADYAKAGRSDFVARGWKQNMEGYYFEYICSVLESREDGMFIPFKSVFPDGDFKERMLVLKKTVVELGFLHEYQSIIDIDMNFFGLVYWVLFRGMQLNMGEMISLKDSLNGKIRSFKNDSVHARAPGLFKYLRKRIQVSCEVYEARMVNA